MRWATSWPVLAGLLIVVTALSIGPLQGFDEALDQPWDEWFIPAWGPFLADVVDPFASQAVAVPLLGVVAVALAWRNWSFRPIVSGFMTELGVVGMGATMKVVFARPSPKLMDPAFFHGGLLSHGWHGISYPSGHAIEAVALYGAIVFLIARYTAVSRRTVALLGGVTAAITVITVLQSMYMQWHWATDLVAGLLVGALILRLVIRFDTFVGAKWNRRRHPGRGRSSGEQAGSSPPDSDTAVVEAAEQAVAREAREGDLRESPTGRPTSGMP